MSESIVSLAEENQRCYTTESSPKFRSPGGISQASEQILVELKEITRKKITGNILFAKKKRKTKKEKNVITSMYLNKPMEN